MRDVRRIEQRVPLMIVKHAIANRLSLDNPILDQGPRAMT